MEEFHVQILRKLVRTSHQTGVNLSIKVVCVPHIQTKYLGVKMSYNKPFDFEMFASANVGHNISGYDYLHSAYKSQELAADFILWFTRLFCPVFKIVDGNVFISEMFDTVRYQELMRDGHSSTQAQFWLNLLEITGLFDELSTEQAKELAESLADSWNSKLNKEFGVGSTLARTICDEETGEVFVTIGAPD